MKFDKKVFFEAVKEPLRLLALALIPFVLAYLKTISYEWVVVLVTLLRFADKYLHELGKEEKNENLVKGLTRF